MDGEGLKLGPIPRFSTIGFAEKVNIGKTIRQPLSGYIGGVNHAGHFVSKLQDDWCDIFKVNHAVACNSATSGLLAACMAIGIGPGDTVWTSAYSMSATAACAKVLGAHIVFIDIEPIRFSMNMNQFRGPTPKCIIVPNLFGHPAYLSSIRAWCDSNKVWMIEDNAQSPFAMENGKYAGTVGHMGVFSFNVHKHIQCGEGGVVVTDDAALGQSLAGAINHGELGRSNPAGLNLRMTEPIAAIACAQLAKASNIIHGRRELAHALTEMVRWVPWIIPPHEDHGCRHVYYVWAARIMNGKRRRFLEILLGYNFPIRAGYSVPLNKVFESEDKAPVCDRMEEEELVTFEICAYDPKFRHLRVMREIIKRAVGELS